MSLKSCLCHFSRQQQGGGGGHDAGVVHAGQQEERPDQEAEPALSAVCTSFYFTK